MLDSISDSAFWSTSAEVIAGLVVAIVFADVARSEPVREQVRWYATLRWAALIAIVGGLAACLLALADAQLRRTWTAVVVLVSVAILGGVVGIRILNLHEQARHRARGQAESS
jgi:predicted membrane-bound spermidine synthase